MTVFASNSAEKSVPTEHWLVQYMTLYSILWESWKENSHHTNTSWGLPLRGVHWLMIPVLVGECQTAFYGRKLRKGRVLFQVTPLTSYLHKRSFYIIYLLALFMIYWFLALWLAASSLVQHMSTDLRAEIMLNNWFPKLSRSQAECWNTKGRHMNPSSQDIEASRSWIWSQPGLHREST